MAISKDFIVKNGVVVLGKDSLQTTSTTTGALVVKGGSGVGGNLWVGGITNIKGNTSATSTLSGALVVAGGVGIGGDLYIGGTFYAGGQAVLTTSSFFSSISEGTDISITEGSSSTIIISNTSTLQSVTVRGSTTTQAINIANSTASTSTNTGALTVAGGVGIGKDLYVGGVVYSNGNPILPSKIEEFTATEDQTTFTITGGYTPTTVQVFANGIALGTSDFTASNGTTVVLDDPRYAGDIIRVIAGGISAPSGGGDPSGNASTIATTAEVTSTTHYLTFVNSNNSSASYESLYTTSSLVVNPGTGNVGIGTASPSQTLDIVGNIKWSGSTNENVYTIADGASVDFNPSNGTIQIWTLSGSRSPTANSFLSGQSMTLVIDDGTDYAITWPSVTWKSNSGVAPTLNTTGYTFIQLWKIGADLYGARVGDA